MRGLLGRDAELAAIDAFVGRVAAGEGGALLVEGEPGCGRTSLLAAATATAPAGVTVVTARGSLDDQLLAYAGLTDLCRPFTGLLDELPAVQAAALRAALAIGPPAGDRLAVAAGFLSLLHVRAAIGPVLCVIDDAHLLDDGTATAVSYAARRLAACAVGLLVAQHATASARLVLSDAPVLRLDPVPDDVCLAIVRSLGRERSAAAEAAILAAAAGQPGRVARLAQQVEATTTVSPIDLAAAARRAVERGSPGDEAAAHEQAAAAADRDAATRLLLAASAAWLAGGELDRARAAADRAAELAPRPTLQAEALLLAGRAELSRRGGRVARTLLHEAESAAHAAGLPELAARAALLAAPLLIHAGQLDEVGPVLQRATARLAGVDADDPDVRLLRATAATTRLAAGEAATDADIADLLAAASAQADLVGVPALVTSVALPLVWAEQYGPARGLLEGLIASARRRGATGRLAMPLAGLALLERRVGRLDRALVAATEAVQVATAAGQRIAELFALAELAQAHAQRGDLPRCRDAAAAVLAEPGVAGTTLESSARSALATGELWSGNWAAVIELLEPLVALDGSPSPSITMFHQNLVAAYVQARRRDDALALLPALERQAVTSQRILAVLERCRGLLADDPGEAERHFERAISAAPNAFGRALSRMLQATRLVDDGRHAEAVRLLSRLADESDDALIGVARAARATLARLGIDLAARPVSWTDLDPAELAVAMARAEGDPLSAVADRLLLTPPEVEALRDRAYRHLGVATAAELPAALAGRRVAEVDVRLLGGLVVEGADGPRTVPAGAPLVALAAVALRRSMHVEALADLLWPDAPADVARRRLRNVLSRLRRAAGDVVVRNGDLVALGPGIRVDVHELDAAVAAGDPQSLARAVRLARGPLLPELGYEDWTGAPRRRLLDLAVHARRALAERCAAAGDVDEALALLDQAMADDPDDAALVTRAVDLAVGAGRPGRARAMLRAGEDRGALGPREAAVLAVRLADVADREARNDPARSSPVRIEEVLQETDRIARRRRS